MSIVDYTYFKGEITIAQLSQPEVLEDVNRMISKYETRFLKSLLGLGFYNAFMDGIDPISGAEERWMKILLGTEYEHNGKDREWIGFQNMEKESPIANYVYTKYLEKESSQAVGIGVVRPVAENAIVVSVVEKTVRAWNEMVEWEYELIRYLDANRLEYPEWKPYSHSRWFYNDFYRTGCGNWPEIFHVKNTLGI